MKGTATDTSPHKIIFYLWYLLFKFEKVVNVVRGVLLEPQLSEAVIKQDAM